MNSRLRNCIKHHTISSRGDDAQMLLHICTEDLEEYLKYKRVAVLNIYPNEYAKLHKSPESIILGYGGMLSYAGKSLFRIPGKDASIQQYMRLTLDNS